MKSLFNREYENSIITVNKFTNTIFLKLYLAILKPSRTLAIILQSSSASFDLQWTLFMFLKKQALPIHLLEYTVKWQPHEVEMNHDREKEIIISSSFK